MTPSMIRDIMILIALTAAMMIAAVVYSAPISGTITLRESAAIDAAPVRLGDVAGLDDGAAALAELILSEQPPAGNGIVVTLADVRRALDQRGVHWGLLTLRGHHACRVMPRGVAPSRRQETPAIAMAPDQSPATAANLVTELDAGATVTLADVVLDRLAGLVPCDRDELIVDADPADRRFLSLPILEGRDRFEIEPQSTSGLGLVPVTIRRYRAGAAQPEETMRIQLRVKRRTLAVVVRTGVAKGQTLTERDVEVREVTIEQAVTPMVRLDDVVGQTAAGVLREGAVVHADDVRSPTLIRRGQLITVRAVTGGLVVRTVCRALTDGGMGDLIQVRNERSRQALTARVTGLQEAVVADNANASDGEGGSR